MNIAFLTSEYPHSKIKNTAGIGTSIKNLSLALVSKGHKVTIFVYSQNCDALFLDQNITIHKIAYKKYSVFSWYFYRKKIQNYINTIIINEKIDLIEAPDWTGITAFMKFKCPLIIRLHGTDAYFCSLEGRKQKFKNYMFEKTALKAANYIVSVSKFTANKTKQLFNLNKDIKIIHNGVDIRNFTNKTLTYSLENNSCETTKANHLLYFGTIIRKKGVLELAAIFNEVVKQEPTATLTLLGKDVIDIFENKSTLQLFKEILSRDASKQLIHISEVPYEKVKEFIKNATVVVLPSLAEAFPMTWLEAMAMGKALVTSDIGWATELMLDGETGYLEDPKNHLKYANKIIELLNNKELNSTFGIQAKERIESCFSLEIIGNQNIEYFQSII